MVFDASFAAMIYIFALATAMGANATEPSMKAAVVFSALFTIVVLILAHLREKMKNSNTSNTTILRRNTPIQKYSSVSDGQQAGLTSAPAAGTTALLTKDLADARTTIKELRAEVHFFQASQDQTGMVAEELAGARTTITELGEEVDRLNDLIQEKDAVIKQQETTIYTKDEKVRLYASTSNARETESKAKDRVVRAAGQKVQKANRAEQKAKMDTACAERAKEAAEGDRLSLSRQFVQQQAERARIEKQLKAAEGDRLSISRQFQQQQAERARIEKQLESVELELTDEKKEREKHSDAANLAKLRADNAQAQYEQEKRKRKDVRPDVTQTRLLAKMKADASQANKMAKDEAKRANAAEEQGQRLKDILEQKKEELKVEKKRAAEALLLPASSGGGGGGGGPAAPKVVEVPMWECDVDGQKFQYDSEASDKLENAYHMGHQNTQFTYMQHSYLFTALDKSDAGKARQQNRETLVVRNVIRSLVKTTVGGGANSGVAKAWKKPATPLTGSDTTGTPCFALCVLPEHHHNCPNRPSDTTYHTLDNNPKTRTSEASRENHELQTALQKMIWLYTSTFDVNKVKKVYVYESMSAKARFQQCKEQFAAKGRSINEKWVFHGTQTLANAHSIVKNGFKVGGQNGHPISNGAIYGQGVYTDQTPATPTQFGDFVVLCLALPGKEVRGVVQDAHQHTKDYDSWFPAAQKDWTVFKRPEQLLPLYVVQLR